MFKVTNSLSNSFFIEQIAWALKTYILSVPCFHAFGASNSQCKQISSRMELRFHWFTFEHEINGKIWHYIVCFPNCSDSFIFYALNYTFYYSSHLSTVRLCSTSNVLFFFHRVTFGFHVAFICKTDLATVKTIVRKKLYKCFFCSYMWQEIQQTLRLGISNSNSFWR